MTRSVRKKASQSKTASPTTQKAGRQLTPAQKQRVVKKYDPEIRQLERLLAVYLNNDKDAKKTLTPHMKKGLKRYLRTQKKSTLIYSIKILRQVILNANQDVVFESREPSSNATKDELIDEYFATLVAGWNAQGSKKHFAGGALLNQHLKGGLRELKSEIWNFETARGIHSIIAQIVVTAAVVPTLMVLLIPLLVIFVFRTVLIIPRLIRKGVLSFVGRESEDYTDIFNLNVNLRDIGLGPRPYPKTGDTIMYSPVFAMPSKFEEYAIPAKVTTCNWLGDAEIHFDWESKQHDININFDRHEAYWKPIPKGDQTQNGISLQEDDVSTEGPLSGQRNEDQNSSESWVGPEWNELTDMPSPPTRSACSVRPSWANSQVGLFGAAELDAAGRGGRRWRSGHDREQGSHPSRAPRLG
jgi:hypothetical protein